MTTRRSWLAALALVLGLAGIILPAATVRAADDDGAKVTPDDAILYFVVQDATGLAEKFKQTNYFGLYKDPAMQPFVGPAEKKIMEKVQEALSSAWGELGMEKGPDKLPWPQGRIVFALRMRMVTHKYSYREEPDAAPKAHEYKLPEPQMVLLADMGKNADLAKELAKKAADKAVEKGARRQKETVRGVELDVITEPPAKGEDAAAGGPESAAKEAVCYGFKDRTLIVGGPDIALVKDVLARMGGGDLASLADDPGLKACRTVFGGSGDVLVYFNAKALIDFFTANADAADKEKITKTMRALGLDNVSGVGLAIEIAPNKTIDMRVKLQLAVRGEKAGILAVLTPVSSPTKPGRLLTKGLASFAVANYDAGKVIDQVLKMVGQTSPDADIDKGMQQAMEATRGEGEAGRPPVNLKTEVLGQLTAPLMVLTKASKPYSAADSYQVLIVVGARDAKVLDTALGRIHETFLAHGDKDLRRELLKTNIYLLPERFAAPFLAGLSGGMGGSARGQLAFAVAGDQLVAGSVKWVEQCIRDLGRSDVESITADPMYQHAAAHLPAQAGIVSFDNQQIAAERLWVQIKDAAKAAAKGGEAAEYYCPMHPNVVQRTPGKCPKCGMPLARRDEEGDAGSDVGLSTRSPLGMIVRELKDFVDFSALPDFAAVKKYFGVEVDHLVGNDQGLYLEGLLVRPPAGAP